jgi:DNA polymerase I-like protein with 3'-5' exonuclease and polymerase domains
LDNFIMPLPVDRRKTALALVEAEIFRAAGRPFRLNSVPELSRVLYQELLLPRGRKTPRRRLYSTCHRELARLAVYHPVAGLIAYHRHLKRLGNRAAGAGVQQLLQPLDVERARLVEILQRRGGGR